METMAHRPVKDHDTVITGITGSDEVNAIDLTDDTEGNSGGASVRVNGNSHTGNTSSYMQSNVVPIGADLTVDVVDMTMASDSDVEGDDCDSTRTKQPHAPQHDEHFWDHVNLEALPDNSIQINAHSDSKPNARQSANATKRRKKKRRKRNNKDSKSSAHEKFHAAPSSGPPTSSVQPAQKPSKQSKPHKKNRTNFNGKRRGKQQKPAPPHLTEKRLHGNKREWSPHRYESRERSHRNGNSDFRNKRQCVRTSVESNTRGAAKHHKMKQSAWQSPRHPPLRSRHSHRHATPLSGQKYAPGKKGQDKPFDMTNRVKGGTVGADGATQHTRHPGQMKRSKGPSVQACSTGTRQCQRRETNTNGEPTKAVKKCLLKPEATVIAGGTSTEQSQREGGERRSTVKDGGKPLNILGGSRRQLEEAPELEVRSRNTIESTHQHRKHSNSSPAQKTDARGVNRHDEETISIQTSTQSSAPNEIMAERKGMQQNQKEPLSTDQPANSSCANSTDETREDRNNAHNGPQKQSKLLNERGCLHETPAFDGRSRNTPEGTQKHQRRPNSDPAQTKAGRDINRLDEKTLSEQASTPSSASNENLAESKGARSHPTENGPLSMNERVDSSCVNSCDNTRAQARNACREHRKQHKLTNEPPEQEESPTDSHKRGGQSKKKQTPHQSSSTDGKIAVRKGKGADKHVKTSESRHILTGETRKPAVSNENAKYVSRQTKGRANERWPEVVSIDLTDDEDKGDCFVSLAQKKGVAARSAASKQETKSTDTAYNRHCSVASANTKDTSFKERPLSSFCSEPRRTAKPAVALKSNRTQKHATSYSYSSISGGPTRAYRPQKPKPAAAKRKAPDVNFVFSNAGFREEVDFNYVFSQSDAFREQERLFRQARERVAQSQRDVKRAPPVFTRVVENVHRQCPDHWKSPDPYVRLGLPTGSSVRVVKKQYRRLARIYHPDSAHPDKSNVVDTSSRFQAVTEAYKRLTG